MKDGKTNIHNIIYIDNDGKMLDKKRFEVKNNNKFFTPQRIKNIVFTLCYIGIIGTIFYNANIIYAWQKDGAYTKELQSDFVKFADELLTFIPTNIFHWQITAFEFAWIAAHYRLPQLLCHFGLSNIIG